MFVTPSLKDGHIFLSHYAKQFNPFIVFHIGYKQWHMIFFFFTQVTISDVLL